MLVFLWQGVKNDFTQCYLYEPGLWEGNGDIGNKAHHHNTSRPTSVNGWVLDSSHSRSRSSFNAAISLSRLFLCITAQISYGRGRSPRLRLMVALYEDHQ